MAGREKLGRGTIVNKKKTRNKIYKSTKTHKNTRIDDGESGMHIPAIQKHTTKNDTITNIKNENTKPQNTKVQNPKFFNTNTKN